MAAAALVAVVVAEVALVVDLVAVKIAAVAAAEVLYLPALQLLVQGIKVMEVL